MYLMCVCVCASLRQWTRCAWLPSSGTGESIGWENAEKAPVSLSRFPSRWTLRCLQQCCFWKTNLALHMWSSFDLSPVFVFVPAVFFGLIILYVYIIYGFAPKTLLVLNNLDYLISIIAVDCICTDICYMYKACEKWKRFFVCAACINGLWRSASLLHVNF